MASLFSLRAVDLSLRCALAYPEDEPNMQNVVHHLHLCARDLPSLVHMVEHGAIAAIAGIMRRHPRNHTIQTHGIKIFTRIAWLRAYRGRLFAEGAWDAALRFANDGHRLGRRAERLRTMLCESEVVDDET